MTLLAGFQALLGRRAGHDDVAVGTVVANRQMQETEALIGHFVNTLVLRTDVGGDPTFRELLARVRETTLGAYAHQDVPFERLVAELQPGRDLGRHPLAQVFLAFQHPPDMFTALTGLAVRPMAPAAGTVRIDLELHVWEQDGELRGSMVYSTDLFDAQTIRELADGLRTLLDAWTAEPGGRMSQLPPACA